MTVSLSRWRVAFERLACAPYSFVFVFVVSTRAIANTEASDQQATPEDWAVHGQSTLVWQYHPAFHSPYRGPHSLDPGSRGDETFNATLYLGFRIWSGSEFWLNPEIDQGFGLSDTLGVAGFPNGQGSKVGQATPYPRLPRAFLRQTIDLGGHTEGIEPDANQLGGSETSDRLVFTFGKFSVVDIFDTNQYAHDAGGDFLNWALIDTGTFDYAANAWGYTYGGAIEWYQDSWTLRAGIFDLSHVPNGEVLEANLGQQFQAVAELEERDEIFGQQGKVKLLAFLSHGRMGMFSDALRLAAATGQPPNTADVRRLHARAGVSLNLEQALADDIGLFARAGYDDPTREPFEYADIDATLATGVALSGGRWNRPDDTVGIAAVVNMISRTHREYLDEGGLGILIGDGRLPHEGSEQIVEGYYSFATSSFAKISFDYQLILNPAYNRDRGPVSVLGTRLHVEF
jgi:high affinity Mn2+ porin